VNDAGKYILSVGLAAILAGILNGFTDGKSSLGALTRMVCGMFLALTVISPFHDLNMTYITSFAQSFDEAAEASVSYGETIADQAVRDIIKQETEAYILDKAGLYQLKLDVEVELGDCEPVPASVSGREMCSTFPTASRWVTGCGWTVPLRRTPVCSS